MVDINKYHEEKSCFYKNEMYLVRDNGAILRKTPPNKKVRKSDNQWTFGKADPRTEYLCIGKERVHRIVATAFLGEPQSKNLVVDHIDTNRKNNRPSNLRWVTKLENVVLNPITRRKIEYLTGVNIFEFLENPSKYRHLLENSVFSWMRTVSEEEAKNCRENFNRLNEETKKSLGERKAFKIGEWIYHDNSLIKRKPTNDINKILDMTSPLAKQKNWTTPTNFICCPKTVEGDPIDCYLNKLSIDEIFSINKNGKSTILKYKKYASFDGDAIAVLTNLKESIKQYGLACIKYKDGYYVHEGLGTFFTEIGAEKRYVELQGLEWDGPESVDDYC